MRVPMSSSLLSQPIGEYCLGIPPLEACEGGVDRSVARRAFAQDLPIAVTARSGKGSPDGFVGHYIDTHRTEIFERLMDGTLANSGLVDRTQLELALRADAKLRPADCRSEEHTSELQSLMRNSYAVFCLKKKIEIKEQHHKNKQQTINKQPK